MRPLTLVVALVSAFVLFANAADIFKVDPVHSSVVFSVQHLGVSNFYGRFNDIAGTVVFDRNNPSKSSVELSVPVESLDTHNAKREQSLKSPDYFDAKQFPTITFKSTKVNDSVVRLGVVQGWFIPTMGSYVSDSSPYSPAHSTSPLPSLALRVRLCHR